MTHPALIERITRSLAYMLRHQPEEFDLEVDEFGYAELEDVVHALNERLGESVEEGDVRDAVESGERQRYEVIDGRIRALYGHSIDVMPGEPSKPPAELYVGVSGADADRAQRYGLRAGRRRFLHLALTPEDALETGRRAGREYAVIKVHALDAWEEGINFYDRRALFLSDPIPTQYLEVGEMHSDGFVEEAPRGRGRNDDRRGPRREGGRSHGPRREEAPRTEYAAPRRDDAHAEPVHEAEPAWGAEDAAPELERAPEAHDAPQHAQRPAAPREGGRRGRGGRGRGRSSDDRGPRPADRGGRVEAPRSAEFEPAGEFRGESAGSRGEGGFDEPRYSSAEAPARRPEGQGQGRGRGGDVRHSAEPARGEQRHGEPRRDEGRREEPRRDEPRRDAPRREEPRREEARRDEPRRDEPRRDEPRRDAPRSHEAGRGPRRDAPMGERHPASRPTGDRPSHDRQEGRGRSEAPPPSRHGGDRPRDDRPRFDRPQEPRGEARPREPRADDRPREPRGEDRPRDDRPARREFQGGGRGEPRAHEQRSERPAPVERSGGDDSGQDSFGGGLMDTRAREAARPRAPAPREERPRERAPEPRPVVEPERDDSGFGSGV